VIASSGSPLQVWLARIWCLSEPRNAAPQSLAAITSQCDRSDDAGFGYEHDGVHAVARPELHQDACDVCLDSRCPDDQLGGDLTVGLSSEAARARRPGNCTGERIGGPDLPNAQDTGLIDINNAPGAVLGRLPDVDDVLASEDRGSTRG
jgi:hypothetical protein